MRAPRVEHADLEREVPQVGDHHLLLGVAVRRSPRVVDPVRRRGRGSAGGAPARAAATIPRAGSDDDASGWPIGAAERSPNAFSSAIAVRRERGRARRRRVGVAVERRVGEGAGHCGGWGGCARRASRRKAGKDFLAERGDAKKKHRHGGSGRRHRPSGRRPGAEKWSTLDRAPPRPPRINDAAARSSCGTECAVERARTAPDCSLFPGWPSCATRCRRRRRRRRRTIRTAAPRARARANTARSPAAPSAAHFIASRAYPPRPPRRPPSRSSCGTSRRRGRERSASAYTLQQGEVACPKAALPDGQVLVRPRRPQLQRRVRACAHDTRAAKLEWSAEAHIFTTLTSLAKGSASSAPSRGWSSAPSVARVRGAVLRLLGEAAAERRQQRRRREAAAEGAPVDAANHAAQRRRRRRRGGRDLRRRQRVEQRVREWSTCAGSRSPVLRSVIWA